MLTAWALVGHACMTVFLELVTRSYVDLVVMGFGLVFDAGKMKSTISARF